MIEPEDIIRFLTKDGKKIPPRIYVLPWSTEEISLKLLDETQMAPEVEKINRMVDMIDQQDPWVLQEFDKKGPGEGVVCYPISFEDKLTHMVPFEEFAPYVFKAKGHQHKVINSKQPPAHVNPDVAKTREKFADLMLAEGRLEQGVKEIGLNKKLTGKFIGWIVSDVKKEGQDELEASGMTWPSVVGLITQKSSDWYIKKCQEVVN